MPIFFYAIGSLPIQDTNADLIFVRYSFADFDAMGADLNVSGPCDCNYRQVRCWCFSLEPQINVSFAIYIFITNDKERQ